MRRVLGIAKRSHLIYLTLHGYKYANDSVIYIRTTSLDDGLPKRAKVRWLSRYARSGRHGALYSDMIGYSMRP
jgi:hypothetical protein